MFSDDLGNEYKSSVGFAYEKYIDLFCFLGEWQNILIFVGGTHAAVEVRVLCKFIIKGRLKMRIAIFSKTTISFSDDLLCL